MMLVKYGAAARPVMWCRQMRLTMVGAKKQGSEMCDSFLDYSVTRFLAMSLEFAAALALEKLK